jgi:hypothetical protein
MQRYQLPDHPAALSDTAQDVSSPRCVSTSTLKKPVPTSTAMLDIMNCAHVVIFILSGAGTIPWRFSTLPTV